MTSGRFQARYYGPDLQYHSAPTTFDTKGDATTWLMTEQALISQQRWTPPKLREEKSRRAVERRRAQVFALYAEQWLQGRVTTKGKALRHSTVAGYRNALDVHILPAFGTLPLDEINSAVIRRWRGQFAARGNDSAGAKAYSVLKAILQTADHHPPASVGPSRRRPRCSTRGGGCGITRSVTSSTRLTRPQGLGRGEPSAASRTTTGISSTITGRPVPSSTQPDHTLPRPPRLAMQGPTTEDTGPPPNP